MPSSETCFTLFYKTSFSYLDRSERIMRYNLTSNHDPDWVQRQLNIAAPKLRSQFALKAREVKANWLCFEVNMGLTPNIRFVPYAQCQEVKRRFLWRFARAIKDGTPVGGGLGTKLPNALFNMQKASSTFQLV